VDVQKYLLDKIVRLSFVTENTLANISNGMRVTSKEQAQCITVPCLNTPKKGVVKSFETLRRNSSALIALKPGRQRQNGKAG
jgi:hypothetical protein